MYDTQSSRWEEALRNRYEMILEAADQITYIEHDYTPGALFARNRYMIDQCDLLLAGSDGKGGGTDQLVQLAKRCRKTVRCIPAVIERVAA